MGEKPNNRNGESSLKIVHLVRTQYFPKKLTFLTP